MIAAAKPLVSLKTIENIDENRIRMEKIHFFTIF